jgi:hypothetical protein
MEEVQTSEVGVKLSLVNVGPWNFACRKSSKDKQLLIILKYERGGRLNVSQFFLMEPIHETLHLGK